MYRYLDKELGMRAAAHQKIIRKKPGFSSSRLLLVFPSRPLAMFAPPCISRVFSVSNKSKTQPLRFEREEDRQWSDTHEETAPVIRRGNKRPDSERSIDVKSIPPTRRGLSTQEPWSQALQAKKTHRNLEDSIITTGVQPRLLHHSLYRR